MRRLQRRFRPGPHGPAGSEVRGPPAHTAPCRWLAERVGGDQELRLGAERDAAAVTSRGPRQAHLEGFDLHANVWVSANDRAGVERLCRYVLRPPFAQERLRLRSDGRVALELKTAWRDGTRELVFEPLEFLERLAAMTRFDQLEGFRRFQNILKKMGVEKVLQKKGAKPGDTVRIGRIEFTFEP